MKDQEKTIESNTGGAIVMYQRDTSLSIDVRIENETVWLTQSQIADLFGVKQPAISKHLKNIFESNELSQDSVHSILEYTATDGKVYNTSFYNLDAILSVGYRVNSVNATKFRQWANTVLKDYLLKGYAVNRRIESLEKKVADHDEKIAFFVKTSLPPVQGIFFDGQIFDAFSFVTGLIKTAKTSITLIDSYIDESVLTMMSGKQSGVKVSIYTKIVKPAMQLAAKKFTAQYGNLTLQTFAISHDRFLILDDKEIYMIGASLKDLGKKWFAFVKIDSAIIKEINDRLV